MKNDRLFLLILFLLVVSCAKEKPFPLTSQEGSQVFETTIYQAKGADFTYYDPINLGAAPHLMLGTLQNQYDARILLKFDDLPDSVEFTDAKIVLKKQAILGDSAAAFTANLYALTGGDWDSDFEYNVKSWHEVSADSTTLLSSADVTALLDDSLVFNIAPSLVQQWVDTTDGVENYGVWIKSESATFIADFYSKLYASSGIGPEIHLSHVEDGQTVTESFSATVDVYLITTNFGDLDMDQLFVGKGIPFKSYLKFDLSAIPDSNATINKAYLRIVINNDVTILSSASVGDLKAQIVSSESPAPHAVDVDSLLSSFYPTSIISDTILFDIRTYVQNWLSQPSVLPNRGLLLDLSNPEQSISRIGFFSSLADSNVAPQIELVYSLPPAAE